MKLSDEEIQRLVNERMKTGSFDRRRYATLPAVFIGLIIAVFIMNWMEVGIRFVDILLNPGHILLFIVISVFLSSGIIFLFPKASEKKAKEFFQEKIRGEILEGIDPRGSEKEREEARQEIKKERALTEHKKQRAAEKNEYIKMAEQYRINELELLSDKEFKKEYSFLEKNFMGIVDSSTSVGGDGFSNIVRLNAIRSAYDKEAKRRKELKNKNL